MRDRWTDERLDDLNGRINERFDRIEAELKDFRAEVNGRLDGIQRSMVHLTVALTAAILAGFGGMATLLATH